MNGESSSKSNSIRSRAGSGERKKNTLVPYLRLCPKNKKNEFCVLTKKPTALVVQIQEPLLALESSFLEPLVQLVDQAKHLLVVGLVLG